jgi:hypothetical protein
MLRVFILSVIMLRVIAECVYSERHCAESYY